MKKSENEAIIFMWDQARITIQRFQYYLTPDRMQYMQKQMK